MRGGVSGTFIDLTPYVTDSSIMPNLSAILEKYASIKAAITQSNGKIYGLPAEDSGRKNTPYPEGCEAMWEKITEGAIS